VSTGNVLLITGEFSARAVLDCARCSSPLERMSRSTSMSSFRWSEPPAVTIRKTMPKSPPKSPYELFEGNNLIVEALLSKRFSFRSPSSHYANLAGMAIVPSPKERRSHEDSGRRPEFEGLANLLHREEKQD